MREDSSTVEAGTEGPVLDGVWLRRERERVAIGRRQVAVRLGLPDSRVIRVEMNRLPVPADWLPALAALGFPVPPEVLPAATGAETAGPAAPANPPAPEVLPSVDPPPVAAEPDVPVTVSPVVSALPSQLLTKAALPSLTTLDTAPESVAEPIAAVPEPAASSSTPSIGPVPVPIAAPVPAAIAEPVPAPIAEPVPAAIVPSLTEESAMAAEPPMAPRAEPLSAPSPAPIEAGTIYTGHWLRRERKKRGMMHIAIAPALHVTAAELASAEAQDSPLPMHWLPSLRQLGLPVSEAAAALAAQSTPSPQVTSPPASKHTAPRKTKAPRTASTAATADSNPESNLPTGAWLRQHRLQRNIMQRELSARLKPNPSELCRYEMEDRPLRPDWLPVLRELGFPLPAAPNDRSPPRGPTTAAESAKQPAKSAIRETASTAIDGRWLKSERTRLGLSLHAVRLHLHVSAKTYARFEASRGLVPRFWWPGLRLLGMRLPAAPPALPSKPTPHSGPLNGAWLVRERKRLRLTQYEVCRVLQANPRMIHRIERDAAELPKAWLAKLPLLGIAVDAAATAPKRAGDAKGPAKLIAGPTPTAGEQTTAAAVSLPEKTKPDPHAPSTIEGSELAALIVHYRVTFGRRAKQAPIEILKRILADLSDSGIDGAVTHDDVEHAARTLLRVK